MANLLSNDALPEFKNHAAFNTSAPSFEKLMLNGEAKDTWINICEETGRFLAATRKNFNAMDVAKVFENQTIRKRSVLGEWIDKISNSWDDSIKLIAPASRLNHLDLERIRERGKQAAELMGKENFVNLDNFLTKNVQLSAGQPNVQINFNAIELVYGPLGLELVMFLADVLVKYHQQLSLEHTIRYVTSECAKHFGRAFDSKIDSNEADSKIFWAQTSLLTGWEIIRRVTEDQALLEWSQKNAVDLVDVFESGLRLVYNGHVDNIGFMIIVALAEI